MLPIKPAMALPAAMVVTLPAATVAAAGCCHALCCAARWGSCRHAAKQPIVAAAMLSTGLHISHATAAMVATTQPDAVATVILPASFAGAVSATVSIGSLAAMLLRRPFWRSWRPPQCCPAVHRGVDCCGCKTARYCGGCNNVVHKFSHCRIIHFNC